MSDEQRNDATPTVTAAEELARSMIRFTVGMSAFGVRQAANLLSPATGWRESAAALDELRETAGQRLGEPLSELYRTGERLATGLLDTALELTRGSASGSRDTFTKAWRSLGRGWRDRPASDGGED